MASVPDYQYAPLPNPSSYIRLLTVSSPANKFNTSLEIFPILEAPPFQALSYAWGNLPQDSPLMCSSAYLHITPHLLEGILRIREALSPSKLWIDAICINQNDADEKAGQIPLMTDIYSHATQVVVWLGTAANGSDRVMAEVGDVYEKLLLSKANIGLTEEAYMESGLPEINDIFWQSLAQLWSRNWFRRLWVVQEVILAKEVIFVCGNKCINMELLASFCLEASRTGILSHITRSVDDFKGVIGHLVLIDFRRHRSHLSTRTVDPLTLFELGRNLLVFEPVDRIYALFGIIKDSIGQSIKVDYSPEARRDYWKLYVSVGKILLEKVGLEMLRSAELQDTELGLSSVPSWIPNWNTPLPTVQLATHFHAGFPKGRPPSDPVSYFIPGTGSIRIPGFKIGTITGTSNLEFRTSFNPQFMGPDGDAAKNLKVIKDALDAYRRACQHPEEVLVKRLARTLVADTGSTIGISESHRYMQDAAEDFIWYQRYLLYAMEGGGDIASQVTEEQQKKHAFPYSGNLPSIWRHRCVFFTDNGGVGITTRACRPGDIVCIFLSGNYPFVLRKVENKHGFLLIGMAYADGVMYGEALGARDCTQDQDFIIH